MEEDEAPAATKPGEGEDQSAAAATEKASSDRIIILATAVGNCPTLKQRQFNCAATLSVAKLQGSIQAKIRKARDAADANIHIFINKSFAPAPDEMLSDLFKCFQIDGKLQIDYALMEAWG